MPEKALFPKSAIFLDLYQTPHNANSMVVVRKTGRKPRRYSERRTAWIEQCAGKRVCQTRNGGNVESIIPSGIETVASVTQKSLLGGQSGSRTARATDKCGEVFRMALKEKTQKSSESRDFTWFEASSTF